MRKAVLQGTAHYGLAIDNTVSLGNYSAIDGAGLMSARGTMILGSIGDDVNLIFVEPLPQALIVADDSGTIDMVQISALFKPQVMIGGRS